jgi:glucose/arabinose dehydrogenase
MHVQGPLSVAVSLAMLPTTGARPLHAVEHVAASRPAHAAVSIRPSATAAPAKPNVVPVVRGTVAMGLNVPWGLVFLPQGVALVAERDTGRIIRTASNGGKGVVGRVPGVAAREEGGLLGLALSPRFSRDRLLYAYFTSARDNRIVRMRYGTNDRIGRPKVLLTGIPKGRNHNGGRLVFGPDGMLYASTGEGDVPRRAQSLKSLGGKILRMTPDGRPAPGNPVKGSVIWSYGHRNVEGLAFDSRHRLWASELGENAFDELNLIRKGRNYGWPIVQGRGGGKRFVDPVVVWSPAEASPSGLAFASGGLWMCALRGQRLWRIPLTANGVGRSAFFFRQRYGRLRSVAAAPGGGLWVTTSNTDGRGVPHLRDDRILQVALR